MENSLPDKCIGSLIYITCQLHLSGFTWAEFVQCVSIGGGGEICTVGMERRLKVSEEAEEKDLALP